jgi:NAD(P)-dependent dehydrogenase (short-subunit alcohol dehydrogenase family)
MSLLKDKVAVVTGSTRGIGLAVAQAFALQGARVIVTGRSDAEVQRVSTELGSRVVGCAGDMLDDTWPSRLTDIAIDSFGRIDIFVNNSGFPISGPLSEVTDSELRDILSVNVEGFIRCARACSRHLAESTSGTLINMSSAFGVMGVRDYSVYSATKSAAIGFTRSLALEWAPMGIRVNAIAPGFIATRINEAARADEDLHRHLASKIPLDRFGEPAEVAAAAVFLASPFASYITGHTLVIDGGLSAG